MPIIGKIKQKDKIKYMVVKTKKGYYPRAKGYRYHRSGKRHRTSKGARTELKKWMR